MAKESMAALRLRLESLLPCFAEAAKAFPDRTEDRQSKTKKRSSIAVE